jgi:hypothetical protein
MHILSNREQEMAEAEPNNNEFDTAEKELRKIGSNLWFSGLDDEWQDFLIANTGEYFDTYEVTMDQAARSLINVFQKLVNANPEILHQNPWKVVINPK